MLTKHKAPAPGRRMRIKVGVNTLAEAEFYLARGADELYCGFPALPSHFRPERPFGSVAELAAVFRLAHKAGRKVFVAANEVYCRGAAGLMKAFLRVEAAGADGFIVKDIETLTLARQAGVKAECHLSTLALCFNSRVLSFYGGLGLTRCVLPEHLPPAEAGRLLRNSAGVETEIFFILRQMCVNIDGACLLCGGGWRAAMGERKLCRTAFETPGGRFAMPAVKAADRLGWFYDYSLAADVVKIDRTADPDLRRLMFDTCAALLDLAGRCASRAEFVRRAKALCGDLDAAALRARGGGES